MIVFCILGWVCIGYDNRMVPPVSEAMLGLEYLMDSLLDYMQHDQMLNVWNNPLIIFTSDNGGALSPGSCNYSLHGGSNPYFDGNQ